MSLFRWIVGLPAACMITVGLFFMMAEMIKNRNVIIDDPIPPRDFKITAEPPPDDPWPDPPKRTVPEEMPETVIEIPKGSGKPEGPIVRPDPKPEVTGDLPGSGGIPTPAIRITPAYPEGCRSKGVEGVVVVEFDVTPEGDVTNARVTSSPDRCFDRPVRNAVSKWKYPPASNNGRPAMRYGLVEVFNFQLVD